MGNDGDDFFVFADFGKGIIDGLGEPIADLTLTHGDCGFERHGGSFFGSGGFFVNEDVADLRTVAVSNDDFEATG